MTGFSLRDAVWTMAAVFLLSGFAILPGAAEEPSAAAVIQHLDAMVATRFERIESYTVTEHYVVFRGKDETHPAAEMTVKTTYRKNTGKSYVIVSESGSQLIRAFGLHRLLDNEKSINQPGNRERAWFTSANYRMQLKPGGMVRVDGRDCLALAIVPRQKAPNLIEGTLWVDAKDASIVRIEGTASKAPSVWAGPTRMMRQYTNVSGFAMATHARAESNSALFGQTVVTIDYRDYRVELGPAR